MAEQKVNFQQDRGEKAEKTDYRIVVLGDDNYITWKWHMTMVLKAKGLFACVESDLVLEPDKAVQATTLLASALSELNMQRVINCNSAFEIWRTLEANFENKSATERTMLLEKFTSYKINTVSDVSKSLGDIQAKAASSLGGTLGRWLMQTTLT